jgi:putative tricarboxylic transport membrane protein
MELFFTALLGLLNFKILPLMALGIVIGLIFGCIPGLTATMAVALILPMTYGMETVSGMSFLVALYVGGISGGLISAILLNIPGTPASIATCFDGNPMAKRGQAGRALAIGIFASLVGGVIGNVILIFLSPPLAALAIRFSPYEYFAVGCFAITVLATLSSGSFIKGLLSGCLGMFASMFGMAPVDGVLRFTFGFEFMNAGFAFLPAMLGAFALSEIFKDFADDTYRERATVKVTDLGESKIDWPDLFRQKFNFLRSGLLGTLIGILPGIGGTTASIIAYSEAKRASKTPEKFGTGISDGLVASETSNNACVGGAMVTMITLGIPGDVVTAILLGGLMIHSVQPGPLLMITNPEVVYGLFAALFLSNILFFVIEYSGVRLFTQVLRVQKYFLYPIIVTMCLIGSYVNNNTMFEVFTMLLFGLIGYLIIKFGYSLPCLVIGFVLGGMIETNFLRAMMFDQGDLTPFLTRPFSLVFLVLTALSIFFAWRRERKASERKNAVNTAAADES